MKVTATHFVKITGGLPVYEMMDGTLRVPFLNGTSLSWVSLKELDASANLLMKSNQKQAVVMLSKNRNHFKAVQEEIDQTKLTFTKA